MLIQVSMTYGLSELFANTVLITLSITALNCSIVAMTVGADSALLFVDQTPPKH